MGAKPEEFRRLASGLVTGFEQPQQSPGLAYLAFSLSDLGGLERSGLLEPLASQPGPALQNQIPGLIGRTGQAEQADQDKDPSNYNLPVPEQW